VTPQTLKKALVQAGFEVFRTTSDEVIVAERVRENLILDSGVRLRGGTPLKIRVVLRAQRVDFPTEEEPAIFDRVRKLAEPAIEAGFAEVSEQVHRITDPADAERVLDTFYEIVFSRDAEGVEAAVQGIKFAMSLEKTVGGSRAGGAE
jgi:hypothetical protein